MQKAKNGVDGFNKILLAMLTKPPKPLEKTLSKRRTSTVVDDVSYDGIQIHADTFEDTSSKPKYGFP